MRVTVLAKECVRVTVFQREYQSNHRARGDNNSASESMRATILVIEHVTTILPGSIIRVIILARGRVKVTIFQRVYESNHRAREDNSASESMRATILVIERVITIMLGNIIRVIILARERVGITTYQRVVYMRVTILAKTQKQKNRVRIAMLSRSA